MLTANAQLVALGTRELNKVAFKKLIDDPLRLHLFDNYDPSTIFYVDSLGREVAKGLPALQAYMESNPGKKVFLGRQTKLFDLALEGGGAFGFSHLGTLHAMALRGIWFDRVSGTSAGSIAAALVAAGYKVDLNYKTVADRTAQLPLQPAQENSLNQILFDDRFNSFTDFQQNIAGVKAIVTDGNSFVHKLVEGFLRGIFDDLSRRLADIGTNLQLTRVAIRTTYLNIKQTIINAMLNFRVQTPIGTMQLDDVVLMPEVRNPLTGGLITRQVTVGSAIRDPDIDTALANILDGSAKKLLDDLTGNTGPIADAIGAANNLVLEGVMNNIVNPALEALVVKDGEVQHVPYGLFRLLEFGGFWDGNYVRDWLERHLQQLVPGTGPLLDGTRGKPDVSVGGAPANAVLFKDLKIDLCIVGADMGPVDATSWKPEPVYFSKRTTPDYPVAEAVRRSISLPFAFIPRKINDGYGNNPPDTPLVYTWRGVDLPSLTAGTYEPPKPRDTSRPPDSYNNKRHHDHLIFDGGVFVNLPVAVFRDPSDFVFDSKKDTKPIVMSNINGTVDSSVRPDDLPLLALPEPFKSFKEYVGSLLPTSGGAPPVPGAGFIKLSRAAGFLASFLLIEHQETEINSLLQLVPNSFFVDIHLRDPHATTSSSTEFTSDGRIDAGNFDMSKTAKKWLVKNAFDAAKAAFAQYEVEVPALQGKLALPKEVDPYLHILEVKNPTANGMALPAPVPLCKQGDNPYTGGNFVIDAGPGALKLGSEIAQHGYVGIGGTWVKMANTQANQIASGSQFLTFETNLRTRVLLAIDGTPSFATTANGWQSLGQSLRLASQSSPSFTALNVFSKMFEKGRITIPGPRAGATANNQFAYAVLVCPV